MIVHRASLEFIHIHMLYARVRMIHLAELRILMGIASSVQTRSLFLVQDGIAYLSVWVRCQLRWRRPSRALPVFPCAQSRPLGIAPLRVPSGCGLSGTSERCGSLVTPVSRGKNSRSKNPRVEQLCPGGNYPLRNKNRLGSSPQVVKFLLPESGVQVPWDACSFAMSFCLQRVANPESSWNSAWVLRT